MLRISPTQAVSYGTNLYWSNNGKQQKQEFATDDEAREFADILREEQEKCEEK